MQKKLKNQLNKLAKLADKDIDMTDMPEQLNWSKASIGKYYKPVKRQISLRLDSDIIAWFKSNSSHYQSSINQALRAYMSLLSKTKSTKAKAVFKIPSAPVIKETKIKYAAGIKCARKSKDKKNAG
jgi:uncharacterized protein (DUF4415 family)